MLGDAWQPIGIGYEWLIKRNVDHSGDTRQRDKTEEKNEDMTNDGKCWMITETSGLAQRYSEEKNSSSHYTGYQFDIACLYKVVVLTFLAIHNLAPVYITDLIRAYEPGRQLPSARKSLLTVPHRNLERFGRRGFSVNAPRLWNHLPDNLRLIGSVVLY